MPAPAIYAFGPFELDAGAWRLTRDGQPVALTDRQVGVLLHLVSKAGKVVSKDDLISAVWGEVAVSDNSIEQVVSDLRRLLGEPPVERSYVETVPRRGYRFGRLVTVVRRESEEGLDALLAPHRAWIEGRAALETLNWQQIVGARAAFERFLQSAPHQASAHVGLANACLMQFETTRADETRDVSALAAAAHHAQEACQLDPVYGEAWATLGFVLDRIGRHVDGLAASRRAVMLEPDNWRHHFRLASVGWGEERLRGAHRTLALLPGFPLAHWLAATVHVARQAFDQAERELSAGILAQDAHESVRPRFGGVALHWLRGLIYLARGEEQHALDEFERELSRETSGHLYARECAANTWYAIGAVRLRQKKSAEASRAFGQALERVSAHPSAQVAARALHRTAPRLRAADLPEPELPGAEATLGRAVELALSGPPADAATFLDRSLAAAAPGSMAWILPVEPILAVSAHPTVWATALARLRTRAA